MKLLKLLLAATLPLLSTSNIFAQKYVGGDISMLPKYEEANVVYKDKAGNTVTDVLAFFKQEGLNTMRVRLFVDPTKDNDKAVCQDLDYVKTLGKRIKDAGMGLILDFHYCDTWADPGKQWTPDAWKNMTDEQLKDTIYGYTKYCLEQMVAAGATPDFIQTGNEISYGMLWGTKAKVGNNNTNRCYSQTEDDNWRRFVALLKQAGKACREVCKDAKIILHTERTSDPTFTGVFYDIMKSNNVDYDIIGLSYYPAYHGYLSQLETTIKSIENKNYGKDIMVVETGYSYAWALSDTKYDYTSTYPYTEKGQKDYTADLVTMLNKHESVKGLFWWWIEDNGNKGVTDGWWNAALYNHDTGQPWAAFYELKNFAPSTSGISGVMNNQNVDNTWYTINGRRLANKPSKSGLYINNKQKVIIQ